jgi:hypothetical protein
VDTGSQPGGTTGRASTTKGTTGPTGTGGVGTGGVTGGVGGSRCDEDPDLCDPSIVGSGGIPVTPGGGGGMLKKCTVNPSTACTADTWTNYASTQMNTACGACHITYGTSCDWVLNKASDVVSRMNGNMPPGGLDAGIRSRLITWINCGAPL